MDGQSINTAMKVPAFYFFGVFLYVSLLKYNSATKTTDRRSSSENQALDLTKLVVKEVDSIEPGTSRDNDIIVVGIAGGSGSGKTTLALAIYEALGEDNITYITHDSYYRDISHLSFEEREKQNFDHPSSLETSLLIEHLRILKKGASVRIPTYDFGSHSRTSETQLSVPRPVILVEGILILSDPELAELIDIRVFVDTEDDIRLIRRIQRDTIERHRTLSGIIDQYLTTVRPMHHEFVERSKKNAHIIIPVGLNQVALELVVSRLKASIASYKEKKFVC